MDTTTGIELKRKELANWTRVAPGWKKNDERQRRTFAPITERLLDRAGVSSGARVLDVACGTGEPALPAAVRAGDAGHVLAIDFVEPMIAFAREQAEHRGLTNVEFRVQDGELMDLPGGGFNAVTIRYGLMFMPDPVACLRACHAALRPEGRIAVACWAAPERNLWAAIPMAAVRRPANPPPPVPGAPGMFAFADPGRLQATLESGGFRDVRVEEITIRATDFPSGAEHFQWTCEMAGPITALYAQLDQATQEQVAREIAGELEARSALPGRAAFDGVTWIASGRR